MSISRRYALKSIGIGTLGMGGVLLGTAGEANAMGGWEIDPRWMNYHMITWPIKDWYYITSVLNIQYCVSDHIIHDGIYGAKTRDAVMVAQRKHGLTPDGIVGPKTAHALGIDIVRPTQGMTREYEM